MSQYYNSTTGQLQPDPPYGNMQYDADYLSELMSTVYADWTVKDDTFTPPIRTESKLDKINDLNTNYNSQAMEIKALIYDAVTVSGDTTTATTYKTLLTTAKTEYLAKLTIIKTS